ncbi:MAG: hypothetical protein WC947_10670 [Elusimicrobiota bacterium]
MKWEIIEKIIKVVGPIVIPFGLGFFTNRWVNSKQQKDKRRDNHFKKIKEQVFNPWLNRGDIFQRSNQQINEILVHDLKNHFPELYKKMEKISELQNQKEQIIEQIINSLQQKYPEYKIYKEIDWYIHYWENEPHKPQINGKDRITGNGVDYAVRKEESYTYEEQKSLCDEITQLPSTSEAKKINELRHLIEKKNEEIIKEMKVLELIEKLPNECDFIK